MKDRIRYILQALLGYERYLFWFAVFKIHTLRFDRKERGFFSFLGLIKKEGVVLDIGANIGIMSVLLAKKGHRVLAIEPIPQNVSALRKVITFFKLSTIQVIECALGDREGEVKMLVPRIRSARMQGLSHVMEEGQLPGNKEESYTVPLQVLDKMEELGQVSVSAIKMDVENYEYFVLNGAKVLLQKNKPIIYAELWDNENRKNCMGLLKELGYGIFVPEKQGLVEFDPLVHRTQNFIFVHKSS